MTSPQKNDTSMIDRAVVNALRKPEFAVDFDWLRQNLDFVPTLWHIVLWPAKPRTRSEGGMFIVDSSQEAEAYQKTVGQVLFCGPLALEGKTAGGQELKNFAPGITRPEELIGKHVVHQSNVGMLYRHRATDEVIKVILPEQILAITGDPEGWKFYL